MNNNVVNIIGPKPIYHSYAVIQGPQVHYVKEKDGRIGFGKVIPGKVYWSDKPNGRNINSLVTE